MLLVLIATGINLRTEAAHKYMTINTATFFFERASYLEKNGRYPTVDETSFAPLTRAEDYPPGLAYAAVTAYRVTKPFHKYNFYEFAAIFPVGMYIVILLAGYWCITKMYSRPAGLIFAALFTILPAAVKLTSALYFTSESVGIFLFLISTFFVIKIEEQPLLYTALSIISVTFFVLTYQLFIPFLIVIAIVTVTRSERKNLALAYISVLILPLIIGHLISREVVGIDYSPFNVFRELFIGISESKTEHYKMAMGRTKLKPLDLAGYERNFSWIIIPLLFAGLIACIRKIKTTAYLIPLLACIIGMTLAFHYLKYRFIALPFMLVVSAIGWDFLYNILHPDK